MSIAQTPRTVLVTGAAGFIGFHLARRLRDDGVHVVGLDDLNAYYSVDLKKARLAELSASPGFEFVHADIADQAAIEDVFARFRPTHVAHLAAQAGVRYALTNPRAYLRSNIDGTLNIFEAARLFPVQHLIYASSSSVYGGNTKVPFSEDDPVERPVSLYAVTKRANELTAYTYAHLHGIRLTGLRFFTVYGPWGRPDMAYFKFADALFKGEPIDVHAETEMTRDFTYIDDIIDGVTRLMDAPPIAAGGEPPHRLFNIGNNRPVLLKDFIAALERATGRTAIKRHLPPQPGEVMTTYASVDKLKAAVGFAPVTPIEVGLERFVAWFRAFYGITD